jgi:hypothetical protein
MIEENYVLFLELEVARLLFEEGCLEKLNDCDAKLFEEQKGDDYYFQFGTTKEELIKIVFFAFHHLEGIGNVTLYDRKEGIFEVYSSREHKKIIKESLLRCLQTSLSDLFEEEIFDVVKDKRNVLKELILN